jgi:hypothetical protein
MKPCEYAMPFVVCPRANVSPALQAEEAWWIPLTGARSGMKRSPMTRISLEVMIERGTAAFTASLLLLLCVESRQWSAVFSRATLEKSRALKLASSGLGITRHRRTNYRVITGCFSIMVCT